MNGYNFTERVRKVLAMAREEAARLHHEYVGTEHILLGLIREGEGVAAAVLQNLNVDLDEVHAENRGYGQEGEGGCRPPAPICRTRPAPRRCSNWRWPKRAISTTATSAPSICCLACSVRRRASRRRS